MENWEIFSDAEFKLRFKYPSITPQNEIVEKVETQREDALGVHLSSPGGQEVYLEVVKFVDLEPEEEYQRHKKYLLLKPEGLSITELEITRMGAFVAHTYTFKWPQKERKVLLVQRERATYRLIYNPQSDLNAQIIATIEFLEGD